MVMLRKIIVEIRTFGMILLIILAAFGCCFQILGVVSHDEGLIAGMVEGIYYSYLLALGEFGLDEFNVLPTTVLLYAFFVLATIILLIVLLNILIALVSSVYEDVISE